MKIKYSTEEWNKIINEYKRTHAVTKITKKYGISKSTLYEWCTKLIYKDRKYSKTNYSNTDIYLLERKIQTIRFLIQDVITPSGLWFFGLSLVMDMGCEVGW